MISDNATFVSLYGVLSMNIAVNVQSNTPGS